MQQILKNFLSNAFKFTADGSVTLEIKLLREHHLSNINGPLLSPSR